MHVFIPNDIEGLESFLQALKNTNLSEIQSKIRETDTCNSFNLRLPKFKIESTLNLVDPLKQVSFVNSSILGKLGKSEHR